MGPEATTGVTVCREKSQRRRGPESGGADRTAGMRLLALWRGYSSCKDTQWAGLALGRSTGPVRVTDHMTTCHCGPA